MKDQIGEVIREKLADALELEFPALTRREARLSTVEGKAHAVIGMRRAGKTTFLYQCLADSLASGIRRERLIYFNFEDERLGAMPASNLALIVEEYYRLYPETRRRQTVTFCLDEIQVVPDWESFVRRIMDSEKVRIFLSGSSARMLSRELATTMRGRAVEVVITPFSFREFLRHRNMDIPGPGAAISARIRSMLVSAFDEYVRFGGFPEALSARNEADLIRLLQGYVDAVLFRDVAERHGVANLVALRAFVRQLLRNPAASLSVSKISNDFRSRGIPASKESLLAFLDYLEDAFLVFALPVFDRSERRRQVNPRKLYLADHALATAFSASTGLDRGHLVENIVACELIRRSRELAYVRTRSGLEVDFLAFPFRGDPELLQVATDVSTPQTLAREVAALNEARREHPDAKALLLAEQGLSKQPSLPAGIRIKPVWQWLLEQGETDT